MCGIAGAVGAWSPAAAHALATRMISALAHRGPDGQRVEVIHGGADAQVALGHARLTVLDPSMAAAQPMRHEGTGSWLVFNGEIYNYRDLRTELEAHGHRFRSSGDSEVLLCALVQWGAAALPRLNGMYAAAFWDAPAQRLLLVRDPFGMKPLYVAAMPGAVLFASELRAFAASGAVDLRLSLAAVHSVLTYGAVVEPATCYTAAVAIPPGHLVVVTPDAQLHAPVDIWSLDTLLSLGAGAGVPPPPVDGPATEGDVRRALGAAVRRHLASDVPLAILLSGGVDSALLAALANRVADPPPDVVTVGFDAGVPSEVDAARTVACSLRSRHRVVSITPRALEDLVAPALAAMDQPTVDGLNVFAVSSAMAAAGIRVLLSGLGGDELFGGYTTFRRVPAVARYSGLLSALAPVAVRLDRPRAAQWRKLVRAGSIADRREAYLVQRAVHVGASHPAAPGVDGPPGNPQMPLDARARLNACSGADGPREVMYLELTFYMRNQLLRDADVFSSAVAVELRLPFLDVDVVRTAWRLPPQAMVAGGGKQTTRRLLQELLPDAPPRGNKQGFTFPWNRWLRGPLRPLVEETVRGSVAYDALGLDRALAQRMLDRFFRQDPSVSWYHVWSLFVLLRWQAERQVARAA